MKPVKTWDFLKSYTQARVGLHRSGHALGTRENLEFQWAHAQARDAIHTPWEVDALREELALSHIQTQVLATQVRTRTEYLMRPDLGRQLDKNSVHVLNTLPAHKSDILILVSNGLSSSALHAHGGKFLALLTAELKKRSYTFYDIFLVPNARVALGDEIGEILKPKLCLTLIGERPGLSSPDSMGLYLTYEPKLGRSDADRNCISNIREPHGLSYGIAVKKTVFLIEESLRKRLSGFQLKDESENLALK